MNNTYIDYLLKIARSNLAISLIQIRDEITSLGNTSISPDESYRLTRAIDARMKILVSKPHARARRAS